MNNIETKTFTDPSLVYLVDIKLVVAFAICYTISYVAVAYFLSKVFNCKWIFYFLLIGGLMVMFMALVT